MTPIGNANVPAVIVGAGPYGLSLAAHLREAGVPYRIFGRPMQSWATQMPEGMKLKSDGFASNLSAGATRFTLEDFCRLTGRPYHPTQIPVSLEDFIAYGQEFARRFVPNLEPCDVISIDRLDGHPDENSFLVTLENGESFRSNHVILATGLSLFPHLPQPLAALSQELVTHTSDHRTFAQFAGRDVVVLGRGASSLNAAALLHEAGSRVTLVTRAPKIHIHSQASDGPRPLLDRLRHPVSPLGHGLRSWLSCTAPGAFHALPGALRRALVYKHLGPAGGTALDGRVEGRFPILLGWKIDSSELVLGTGKDAGKPLVKLILIDGDGQRRQILTSHIIAGTGFRVALSRMRFLASSLRAGIRTEKNGTPRLSRSFQSSVPGLYFIGPASAASFGPLLRFAAGAHFAAEAVTGHLVRAFSLCPAPEPDPRETSPARHVPS
jgi:thioredoxin reductase